MLYFVTDVSERFIYKLMNEARRAEESNIISTRGNHRQKKRGRNVEVDDFDIGVIRTHDFFCNENEFCESSGLSNSNTSFSAEISEEWPLDKSCMTIFFL